MPQLEFWAGGIPAPQGSKVYAVSKAGKAYGREANKGLPHWRRTVQEAASGALMASDDWERDYDGPVGLVVVFNFPVISSGRHWKTSAPDADKLMRAVGDALTKARVWKDDSRAVCIHIHKVHAVTPGAHIRLRTLNNHPIETEEIAS